MDNNGSSHSLLVSWGSAEGRVDFYLLTLSDTQSPPRQRRLPPNVTRVMFEDLTPGRSYQLSVKTTAGAQSTETRASCRTGELGVSSTPAWFSLKVMISSPAWFACLFHCINAGACVVLS